MITLSAYRAAVAGARAESSRPAYSQCKVRSSTSIRDNPTRLGYLARARAETARAQRAAVVESHQVFAQDRRRRRSTPAPVSHRKHISAPSALKSPYSWAASKSRIAASNALSPDPYGGGRAACERDELPLVDEIDVAPERRARPSVALHARPGARPVPVLMRTLPRPARDRSPRRCCARARVPSSRSRGS